MHDKFSLAGLRDGAVSSKSEAYTITYVAYGRGCSGGMPTGSAVPVVGVWQLFFLPSAGDMFRLVGLRYGDMVGDRYLAPPCMVETFQNMG